MDDDLLGLIRRETEKPSRDLGTGPAGEPASGGTGLCPEAQADGVPCYTVGRSCEVCGRARTWTIEARRAS